MSDSKITKRVLAESIKSLMETTPLSKISVGDIAANCGLNRQTFYYHFKDKYDLVNWIYYTEAMERLSRFADIGNWADGLLELCLYMQKNKKFYINALKTKGQNSFPEYLRGFVYSLVITLIDEMSGEREINKEFYADFFSYAFIGIMEEWAQAGMADDPHESIELVKAIVEGGVNSALHKA